jgi:hypothetical protein
MKQNNTSFTTYILWAVYISLLGVLLPHTAWAFKNWEPTGSQAFELLNGFTSSDFVSYIAAFVFEAAIATLTHKLSKVIDNTPKGKRGLARFSYRYLNSYSILLVGATAISILANLAHAVEFGGTLKIFTAWGISQDVYSVAFGGALPLVSLGFANVLSNVTDDEEAPNPEFTKLNESIAELRKQLRDSEQQRRLTESLVNAAEQKVRDAEERVRQKEAQLNAVTELAKALFGDDKRQRILIARQQWRGLPNSALAVIAEASPSYVSEVLKEIDA